MVVVLVMVLLALVMVLLALAPALLVLGLVLPALLALVQVGARLQRLELRQLKTKLVKTTGETHLCVSPAWRIAAQSLELKHRQLKTKQRVREQDEASGLVRG